MGWFSRVTPELIEPLLRRIARLEGAAHPTAKFRDRSPFGEERGRLFSLLAQDRGIGEAELARRLAADPERLTEEAVAWQQSIDRGAERAALDEQIARSGRIFKGLLPHVGRYVLEGQVFGPKVAEKLHFQFRRMGRYFSFSPGRRGFLYGRIEPGAEGVDRLVDQVWSGRYNLSFRGQCDKVWDDLTYLRLDALAYAAELIAAVVSGNCGVESTYLRKAMGIFGQHYAGDLALLMLDILWWGGRELVVRREQRLQVRRERTCAVIDEHELVPAGYQEEFYWIFDGALAELQLLGELSENPHGERRRAARRIDRLVHLEPPAGEAAFYYDQRLFLMDVHLAPDPAGHLIESLRGVEQFEEYHKLMRSGWERIQEAFG